MSKLNCGPWAPHEVSMLATMRQLKMDWFKISKELNRSIPSCKTYWRDHFTRSKHQFTLPATRVEKSKKELEMVAKKLLKTPQTPSNLATALGVSMDKAMKIAKELGAELHGSLLSLNAPRHGYLPLHIHGANQVKIGLVADTHLGCKEERLAELHNIYDIFVQEGVTSVFHAGNLVDGYIPRINGESAIVTTPDGQAHYVIDNYPKREGITTYYITGDDHEGWWIKEGLNWGKYLYMLAQDEGREDLVYLGHVEADVEFKTGKQSTIMKVQHPGGGSAYARSYTSQKIVDSFEGGEKPALLVIGHYHVQNYMQDRNVHVIQLPGFQDQTIFARKKRLRMEVGGCIAEFFLSETGLISRMKVEFIRYFNRGYYKPWLRSDATLEKGHLSF